MAICYLRVSRGDAISGTDGTLPQAGPEKMNRARYPSMPDLYLQDLQLETTLATLELYSKVQLTWDRLQAA